MTKFIKRLIIFVVVAVIAAFVISFFVAFKLASDFKDAVSKMAVDFETCAALGYPVMESYPRQCATPEGKKFVEDIGNELEKTDLIKITAPRPNEIITSPLTIEGEARGYWFFEASFPVKLVDAAGKEIATGIAEAQSDWMTEKFVPFKATLEFSQPETLKGTLILQKDNPSGLSENDDSLKIPVKFQL